ncbi:MAG: RecX family transcriptional regulator [Chloroflexia bacterium]|nr:RecX family transcriptional regulator [Chloroflexia bacterium]
MIKELSKEKGLARAQAICAKAEKCKADIRQKLYDWKVNSKYHEEILDSLVKDRFIDEERYVSFFVRDKFNLNGWGKVKIEYALRSKQIAHDLIQQHLEQIDSENYKETCKDLIIKKLKTIKEEDTRKLKEKILRFAHGRGYEASIVISIVNELVKENDSYEEKSFE